MTDQFDRDMVLESEHYVGDGGTTQVNANADMDLPEFDIHVETCVMGDVDAGKQVVMWKAHSDNEVSRSSSPMGAVMEVIERETGGVV